MTTRPQRNIHWGLTGVETFLRRVQDWIKTFVKEPDSVVPQGNGETHGGRDR